MESKFFGKDGLIWWKGVVEDRKDPIMLGRVRVRIFGWHTEDKAQMPTETLPWAMPSLPGDNGRNVVGYKEGDWCWGFFLDGLDAQKPIVVGFIPGIDTNAANPQKGFNDPTSDSDLMSVPRPPEMVASTGTLPFDPLDPTQSAVSELPEPPPGANLAFGELLSTFDISKSKFDVNRDGTYNAEDAQKMIDAGKAGGEFFSGEAISAMPVLPPTVPMSRYPLESRLKEPMTSRLARNERIEETIVSAKNSAIGKGEGAGYKSSKTPGDDSPSFPFEEPQSPYAAKYPYNHVYESEAGHVIEVDDTPGAERMHWYHRTGTFTEIHPNGLEVNRIVNKQYNFIYQDFFLASGASINMDAKAAFRMKCGQEMNRHVGGNMNANVSKNYQLNVGGDMKTEVSGNYMLGVGGDGYVYVDGGVLYIKVAGDISIESVEGSVEIKSPKAVSLSAPVIHLQGQDGGEATINLVSSDINANYLTAHKADSAPSGPGDKPDPPEIFEGIENNADEAASASSAKDGFMLPTGDVGDLWKPVSDSNGNLVTLGTNQTPHKIHEALPTGELEAVMIKYRYADNSEKEWQVVRPVHTVGEFIDSPIHGEMFEDGQRYLQRWKKPGGDYPQQVFWITGSAQHLILDSSARHMCWGAFNDKLPLPSLTPIAPEEPETPNTPDTPAPTLPDVPADDVIPDDGIDDGGL